MMTTTTMERTVKSHDNTPFETVLFDTSFHFVSFHFFFAAQNIFGGVQKTTHKKTRLYITQFQYYHTNTCEKDDDDDDDDDALTTRKMMRTTTLKALFFVVASFFGPWCVRCASRPGVVGGVRETSFALLVRDADAKEMDR